MGNSKLKSKIIKLATRNTKKPDAKQSIEKLREELQSIDIGLIALLKYRIEFVTAIARVKEHFNQKAIDSKRKQVVKKIYSVNLGKYGEDVYEVLHKHSVKEQNIILKKK